MKASPRAGPGTHTAGQASALYPSGSPEPFDAATDESNSELLKTQLNALFNAGPSAAVAPKCIVVGRDIDTLVNVLSQKTSLKVLKTRTLADVALIHRSQDLQLRQVIGDQEEGGRGEAGGDGLPFVNGKRQRKASWTGQLQ